jgi:hypothetical protein
MPTSGDRVSYRTVSRILTHYGCDTAVGRLLQVSLELMLLELGISGQPLQADYNRFSDWVTDSWLKSLWEKVFLFGVVIIEGKLKVEPPRTNDDWLMMVLLKLQFTEPELIRLNGVRIHQQVLFVSDVMDVRGCALDQKYLSKQTPEERWSSFRFLIQSISNKDFRLWKNALHQLHYARMAHLGDFIWQGHKQWGEWRFDEERNQLLRRHDGGTDIYTPSEVPRYANQLQG